MRARFAQVAALLGLATVACRSEAPEPPRRAAGVPAAAPPPRGPAATSPATFVGRAACADCHAAEAARHHGSHHDRAMEVPDERSVRGDFGGARFVKDDLVTTFLRRDARYVVRIEAPGAPPEEHAVAYTFGVEPLQQYLLEAPGGRLQAFTLAWDTRPVDEGGQRWFDLQPAEHPRPGEALHWTGSLYNWQAMCAPCHSTGLEKRYRAGAGRYETSWAELDVSCEACHGPASRHLAWAASSPGAERDADPRRGFAIALGPDARSAWAFEGDDPIARRVAGPNDPAIVVDTCAPCHARRSQLSEQPPGAGASVHDLFRVALLSEGLYHADGQVQDEVFEYGSFLQSRMAHAGVTCIDCHEPHSARLVADGNALCARCHRADVYDAPIHHGHAPDTPGARCVTCHMPARTFMEVDDRRDHGFRVPRPELARRIGAPDPCTACHAERGATWAAEAIGGWRAAPGAAGTGPVRARPSEVPRAWAEALHAGRSWAADAEVRLAATIREPTIPAIVRATAVELLARYAGPWSEPLAALAARDASPLVRRAAAALLPALDGAAAGRLGGELVADPVRSVRLDAVSALAGTRAAAGGLGASAEAALERAFADHERAHELQADRAEGRTGLAMLAATRGDVARAERELRAAIRLEPAFAPAHVNLADVLRASGRDGEAEHVLRGGLGPTGGDAALHHALGLTLVRLGRRAEALHELERAVAAGPGEPRYAYVQAIALLDAGRAAEATALLERTAERFPGYRDVLAALATLARDGGDLGAARRWAERLAATAPRDPAAAALVAELAGAG